MTVAQESRDFAGETTWYILAIAENITCLLAISYAISCGGLQARNRWPEIQERMVNAMARLEKALKPDLQRLK
jgi:hypothetical protein